MKKILLILIFFALLFQTTTAQKRKSRQQNDFIVQPLAPGVWAAIQNDQFGQAICNAGIVDLGDKTLVFDPFMNPSAAKELKNVAEDLTHKPVTLVVNSHYHNDHIRGNQVFPPYVTIISTEYTKDRIPVSEAEEQAWEKRHVGALLQATKKMYANSSGLDRQELPLWIGYYQGIMESMNDLKLNLPSITFRDSITISGNKLEVKLVEFKNCHTPSDAVLFIPSLGIAFMGDILFVKRHPWLSDGNPTIWRNALDKLSADKNYKIYVPGHGPISDAKGLVELSGYIKNIQQMAREANTDSLQNDLLIKPIAAPYASWFFGRFYEPNLKFLFAISQKH